MAINAEFLNTDQRCACALVLDTSGSMQGEPIDHLNNGLKAFEEQLKADRLASRRIELALITFGNEGVRLLQPFVQSRHFTAPVLDAKGTTPMGEAVTAAVQLLRHRKNEYRTNGVQYYRPWLMLITDGEPTDEWQHAAAEIRQEEQQRGLTCFPIGVGDQVNFDVLRQFSSKLPAHLNGFDFEQLFVWLSGSLGRISASRPGDQVELAGVDTWGSVRRVTVPSATSTARRWTVSVARVRGSSHTRTDSPCQDDAAFRSVAAGEALVLAVSDGAGSGSLTHLSSAVAVRSATFHVAAHYAVEEQGAASELLARAAAKAREDVLTIYGACARVQGSPARVADFACTLLLVLICPAEVSVLQIGDGAVVAESGGALWSLSPAVNREYVNETDFLTDDGSVVRAHRQTTDATQLNGIAVMSDGVQHLAVDPSNVPFHGFFNPVFAFARANLGATEAIRSKELSSMLSAEAIDDITDDDRTLLVAVREHR